MHAMPCQDTLSPLGPFLDRLLSRSVPSRIEQDAILKLPGSTMHLETHRDFVRLGERVDHACFVVAGLVGRFDQNANGDRQITAIHIAGDMPDLHSVVQPTATSALQALTTSTLLRVPHGPLRKIAAQYPAIGEAFWRDTMVDSMMLAQWIVNIGRRDAKSRIAHLLCELAVRLGAEPSDNRLRFRLPLIQSQIADACGLIPVHVNRSLKAIAADGTLVRSRMVIVEDWDRLVEIGDFDPSYLQRDAAPEKRIRIMN
jgi:CRP-like cAMP-binding protein